MRDFTKDPCANCGHTCWEHEPTSACRLCEALERPLCSFRGVEPDPNPMPVMKLWRFR